MSYLAIGSVTRAISELLSRKLNKPPLMGNTATFRVTTLPPDDDRVDGVDGVNLFLYRVTENPFIRNMDWRGDRTNPNGSKKPPLSLTLHYIMTAYARRSDDTAQDDITAHQILGNAMAILHENPVLNDVHDSDFDAGLDTQLAAELRNSFEKVKITMKPISMEEFSNIWTGLSKAYRLSVGYEVSLVQIAPIEASGGPDPPAQKLTLGVGTVGVPKIARIEPASGPAGAEVTITGSGFKSKGVGTSVSLGDTGFAETDLVKITSEEIVLNVPEAPQRGPKQPVSVSVAGRESDPVFYEIIPWIDSIQPLRGITGIPLEIAFDVPSGLTVSVEIDGQTATLSPSPPQRAIRAIVPNTIASNGPKPVVVILSGTPPQRSNTRFFEVIPSIQSVNVSSVTSPASTTIEVNGSRLNGTDVNVRYGGLLIRGGENTNSNQVTVQLQRVLPAGETVSVIVDGRESSPFPPDLDRIEPPEAFAGDEVTLFGNGLTGGNVVIHFGGEDAMVGAHSYSTQITVNVPLALASGTVSVSVTVDGEDTGSLQFDVLG